MIDRLPRHQGVGLIPKPLPANNVSAGNIKCILLFYVYSVNIICYDIFRNFLVRVLWEKETIIMVL